MPLDFPSSPSLNQIYPTGATGPFWKWNGYAWDAFNPYNTIRRFDTLGSYLYCGTALSGSSESATVWTIVRLTVSPNGTVTSSFTRNNVAWTNRYTAFGFDFTFSQEWASVNGTVNSISGFVSDPAFTSTSGPFVFSSLGSIGTITFGFSFSSTVVITSFGGELIKNSVSQQIIVNSISGSPVIYTFDPISVSFNDSIVIKTYISD